MINFINSIGQRKVSKILFAIAVVCAMFAFILKSGVIVLFAPLTWLGIFLMSAPVGILSKAAHKTKDFRLFCLVSQFTIIVLNLLLFFLDIPEFFFLLTIIEVIATSLFLIIFGKRKPVKKVVRRTRATTQSKDKDEE